MVTQKTSLKKKKRSAVIDSHMDSLSSLFEQNRHSRPQRAQRYVELLRRLSQKCKHPLPRFVKHSYCKHCKVLFFPGKNCRVRVHKKRVIYTCFSCNKQTRIPYGKK